MAATLAGEQERRSEAARRECFSAGGIRERDLDDGRRATGLDAEGDGGRAAQAAHSDQPECAFAFLWAPRRHLQKKACRPPNDSEPTWPARGGVGSGSKVCLTLHGWGSSTRPRSAPIWSGCEAGPRAAPG